VLTNIERAENALRYLALTDDEIAEAKMQVSKSEYLAKLREAFAFKAAEGETVRDREVSAKTDPESQQAWNTHFLAVTQYEKLRAKRERAFHTLDWARTLEASRRQGSQVT